MYYITQKNIWLAQYCSTLGMDNLFHLLGDEKAAFIFSYFCAKSIKIKTFTTAIYK